MSEFKTLTIVRLGVAPVAVTVPPSATIAEALQTAGVEGASSYLVEGANVDANFVPADGKRIVIVQSVKGGIATVTQLRQALARLTTYNRYGATSNQAIAHCLSFTTI